MEQEYNPKAYWEQRLADRLDVATVGNWVWGMLIMKCCIGRGFVLCAERSESYKSMFGVNLWWSMDSFLGKMWYFQNCRPGHHLRQHWCPSSQV
ncbi:MAG: hypothetical protein QXP27_04035 [Candidatus Methanomethyliaceae archaeon]